MALCLFGHSAETTKLQNCQYIFSESDRGIEGGGLMQTFLNLCARCAPRGPSA